MCGVFYSIAICFDVFHKVRAQRAKARKALETRKTRMLKRHKRHKSMQCTMDLRKFWKQSGLLVRIGTMSNRLL